MKCPHCLVAFHDAVKTTNLGEDIEGAWAVHSRECPSCNRLIFNLASSESRYRDLAGVVRHDFDNPTYEILIRPRETNRSPIPPEVPSEFAEDYREACLVLADSPKASAALSRRCLQSILREKASVKSGDLAKEIQEVIDNNALPTHISESLHAVRNVGNFAAHPVKSSSTGEIMPVEPGEAEWSLDVIEMLYDFYFVQPARAKEKREALNQKLADAGRPLMK